MIDHTFETIPARPVGFIVSADLGKLRDWTAISIVTRSVGYQVHKEKAYLEPFAKERDRKRFLEHGITHLERPALGTPYPDVVRRLCVLMDDLPMMPEQPELVIDETGVGVPIVDLCRSAGLRPVAMTITGGKNVVTHSSRRLSVPKRDLAENVKALIQDGRLKFANGLELAAIARQELAAFGRKIADNGHETFDGVGEHDDIVMSIAMGVWRSEHKPEPIRGADINVFDHL
ncbi:MAG: hypothetical protein WCC64_09940 [Aliidongia sp.]